MRWQLVGSWGSVAERRDELFRSNARLFQNTVQCSNFQFTVKWDYTAAIVASHDYMAAPLSGDKKSQALKNFDTLGATDAWQFRHHRPQSWSTTVGRRT